MKTIEQVLTAKPTTNIIIVTCDSGKYAQACILSILRNTTEPFRFIIVNNGKSENFPRPQNYPHTVCIQNSENLGWMGGVNSGLKWSIENSDAPFIVWMNDDTQVLDQDHGWLTKMLYSFQLSEKIGAVGPMSNSVMGFQNSAYVGLPPQIEATRISGMCFVTKREIVQKIGFLDESLPGGDDLDYSIRLRKEGYKLCVCRRSFLLHHYGITGKRLYGDYWDSIDHSEKINMSIIKKHGFKWWWTTINDIYSDSDTGKDFNELEKESVLINLNGELDHGKVLDLGCGGEKIHPNAIGVDLRPGGEVGVGANVWYPSKGDVVCNVVDLKPFESSTVDAIVAKHLLEHIMDIPKALREWYRVLKPGGKLIIICPDYKFCQAISCDPSHVWAFTPESQKSIIESCSKFKVTKQENLSPGYVFLTVAEKEKVTLGCAP